MDSEYIDQFFSDGSLRLASFAKFSRHTDEQRRDTSEGKNMLVGSSENQTVVMMVGRGDDTYIASSSLLLDRSLMEAFGCDGVFEITDTVGFAAEVARQLVGFKGGLEGPCFYAPRRMIKKELGAFNMEDHKREDGTIDMKMLFDLHNQLGGSGEFLLKADTYKAQLEYRFVWAVDSRVGEHIDIKCPAAEKFCRKVDSPK